MKRRTRNRRGREVTGRDELYLPTRPKEKRNRNQMRKKSPRRKNRRGMRRGVVRGPFAPLLAPLAPSPPAIMIKECD